MIVDGIFTVKEEDIESFDKIVAENLERQKHEVKFDFSKIRKVGESSEETLILEHIPDKIKAKTKEDIEMSDKELFYEICEKHIKRDGFDKLLAYLEPTDYFTAPASTKFHNSYEGGLLNHNLNVYKRLKEEMELTYGELSPERHETVAICALFHDLCKTNYYAVSFRNAKNASGIWESVPYYTVDDKLPYGHGEKSVYILSGFIRLSREEALAIRWHMGFSDESVKGGNYSIGTAFEKYPLSMLLHIADLKATYIDEVRGEST